ncbi:CPBP family intramembrane metalloprotease [Streptococcus equi subsp. zooepidemicus]|uniref:CAAX amino terminal protease family protein n=2 Tax=Streptococcus equi subsp. zooepidemicus TaxID=40041 RepID=B4U104_STREM|nr:CAAX amino terminal protease family protein [Streptococcus equi subsp. zooepidemicus MGCS10565]AEJ24534.1 CAAX amino terminal protease family protein [Streptococcus equi subsp. zooepidemicus ATCC 35246]MBR7683971.1 CPBP family intramembrane metalloprotease [Streptococcus equi subsp. zooepidemicus]HEL1015970.1 CPBP family intramembrane metalloprotease [Streptococcus equi subsp. ruminatorum]MBR7752883.1 CPBP family intramembrane metalloprotease [Streptococcus equi subsp. zooepidemicus]
MSAYKALLLVTLKIKISRWQYSLANQRTVRIEEESLDIIKRHRAAVLVMLYIIAVYLYRQVSNVIELPPLLNTFLFYGRHLLIFALGICWLYRADYQRDWQQFSTKWVKNTLWVLVIFAVLYAANILLSSLPLPEGSNAAVLANRYNASEGFETVIFILVVSIIGPFNEELIFRKILIGEGQSGTGMLLARLLGSSLLFGLVHIYSFSELSSIVVYGGLGLLLGLVYVWKKNIYFSTAAHILNNGIGYVFILLELLGVLR